MEHGICLLCGHSGVFTWELPQVTEPSPFSFENIFIIPKETSYLLATPFFPPHATHHPGQITYLLHV